MSKFEVEKGVDLSGRQGKYPWAQMDDGDSFWIEGNRTGYVAAASGRQWLARNGRDGWRVVTRRESRDDIVGSRVWIFAP